MILGLLAIMPAGTSKYGRLVDYRSAPQTPRSGDVRHGHNPAGGPTRPQHHNHIGVFAGPAFSAGYGRGSNGYAVTHTYPHGSLWSETARFHPTSGRQNGTDRYYGELYAATYSKSGAYIYDPDHRAVLADR